MSDDLDVNDAERRQWFLKERLPLALAALTAETPPLWGAMAAQQMLEHLAWTFEISTGRLRVECRYPADKQQHFKGFLYVNNPTPRSFANPELVSGLPALRHASLQDARAALQEEVQRFLELLAREPGALHTHPIFGDITVEEWSRTHYKHTYHHLLQFGLIK
jgi:hypothetical protein